jgi:hypothetical protein
MERETRCDDAAGDAGRERDRVRQREPAARQVRALMPPTRRV